MHIAKIEVQNFRLLKDATVDLSDRTTLIVGRNNSGKTSLTEIFKRLLTNKTPSFELHDFSMAVHEEFWNAFELFQNAADDMAIRAALPKIKVQMEVEYDLNAFAPLKDFIVDLIEDETHAIIEITYQLRDGKIKQLFEEVEDRADQSKETRRVELCRVLKTQVPRLYTTTVEAVNPQDQKNRRPIDWSLFQRTFKGEFIMAQRGLDDTTDKERDVLAKILENMLHTAMSNGSGPDEQIANGVVQAVSKLEDNLRTEFSTRLTQLLPNFEDFGYKGLRDTTLEIEANLDVQQLLSNHTKIRYTGCNGVHLPESYNGLGVRNLVYILLKLLEIYKRFIAAEVAPVATLVFIEEPEVHLHPQMQEVFISQLESIVQAYAKRFKADREWDVQFIITTHSSHIANRAEFSTIRYFLASDATPQTRRTVVKNIQKDIKPIKGDSVEFLHKYMTLTKCDLLFADKAILIEGPTERILLPLLIAKSGESASALAHQFIAVLEVGGDYAHLFIPLLELLELPTLIITDIDTTKKEGDHYTACPVAESSRTSNKCINNWFNPQKHSGPQLLQKTSEEKTNGTIRLAYQVPENVNGDCGRSFEEAFVLANSDKLEFQGVDSWTMADKLGKSKTDTALRFALDDTDWNVPLYISEGLHWLSQISVQPENIEAAAEAAFAKEAVEAAVGNEVIN